MYGVLYSTIVLSTGFSFLGYPRKSTKYNKILTSVKRPMISILHPTKQSVKQVWQGLDSGFWPHTPIVVSDPEFWDVLGWFYKNAAKRDIRPLAGTECKLAI